MLQYTLSYGIGSKDEHAVARVLGVLKNLLDQVYFPVEHMAWAADQKIVKAQSSYFYTFGTILWGLSSYIGIVKSLIMMSVLQRKTRGVKNVVLHEKIVGKQLELLLLACQEAADFVLAVNYLPAGSLLWAGTLKKREIGLIGTFSSILRLLMLFRHMKNNNDIVS
ncbi:hypothetical protein JTE90_027735 [Oedothorax gibbosus]|uniref:Peroxisomal membrane protein 11C n=1 Tax=Oedothorax gibbosus TaxID=931172 RepID=A0AAV6UH73_9ARAC|nr:hypothetical protein JTE90_027735 [Oedothorax gibbosus]